MSTQAAGFLSAGLAGGVSQVLIAPLDFLKVAQQTSQSNISTQQLIRQVWAKHGFKGFWRGNVAATSLSVAFCSVQFTVYHEALAIYHKRANCTDGTSAAGPLLCGGLAAGVATTVTFPFDVVRTRMVATSPSGASAFTMSGVGTGGLAGFWRGLTPALLEVCPGIGINFAVYESLAAVYRSSSSRSNSNSISSSGSWWCGFVSGSVAKLLVYPLDTCKKRMQVGGAGAGVGVREVAQRILRTEGMPGFFAGVRPSIAKSGISSGVLFLVYNNATRLLCNPGH